MTKPSHLDAQGGPRMVDVSAKPVTARRAVAAGSVRMRPDVLAELLAAGGPKGDALVTARLAGIGAAKRTAELIPLCHPLPLDRVDVQLVPDAGAGLVRISAEVAATARTGVEMEALTAVSIAALTLYDMAKALQRDIVVERVELLHKAGGAGGAWSKEPGTPTRPERDTTGQAAETAGAVPAHVPAAGAGPGETLHEAVVVTCSDRSAAGERADASGPAIVTALAAAGWDVASDALVVPDDESLIAETLAALADQGHRLILTTGGTGLSRTDVTPAATMRVVDRQVPGLAERMRAVGGASTPMAALSRAIAGSRGQTLIVNLPGSVRGANESLEAILPILRHAVDQLGGGDH